MTKLKEITVKVGDRVWCLDRKEMWKIISFDSYHVSVIDENECYQFGAQTMGWYEFHKIFKHNDLMGVLYGSYSCMGEFG